MKKILKNLMVIAMALTVISPLTALPAMAVNVQDLTGETAPITGVPTVNNVGTITNMSNADPRTIAANIIRIALGFLGILAVIIILIGGFKWMTAAGNEDGIADAKKILVAGVIGLVIILASWGIANFVLTSLTAAI